MRGNIPLPPTHSIAHPEALTEIRDRLANYRLVTLTGAGGIGKTWLAKTVAHTVQAEFPQGVWWVDITDLQDEKQVVAKVAKALDITEEAQRPLRDTLIARLHAQHLLLVIDNCEHLIEETARLMETLLTACPHLRLLATSRQMLGLFGEECVWRVPVLTDEDALSLFVERARLLRSDYQPTDEDVGRIMPICRRLDSIPLAIELAAARLSMFSLTEIEVRLEDRFAFLTNGRRTALPRHKTLRALMDWSYALLTPPEQALLHALAVFAGSWTLEAAEAVCDSEVALHGATTLDILTSLVEKSLVIVYATEKGETRFRLLETVREYAWECLEASGRTEVLRERHLLFFRDFAASAEPHLHGPEQILWLARLDAEQDNFRAALAGCLHWEKYRETGLQLAAALTWFWYRRGAYTEGMGYLQGLLDETGTSRKTKAQADALWGVGLLAYYQGDRPQAIELLRKSILIYRSLDDRKGMANAQVYLGVSLGLIHDYTGANQTLTESVCQWRVLGDAWGLGMALWGLGWLFLFRGEYALAQAPLEESIELFENLEDMWGIGAPLRCLGAVAQEQGDLLKARHLLTRAVAAAQASEDPHRHAYFLCCLAVVLVGMDQMEEASSLYHQSQSLFERLGIRALNQLYGKEKEAVRRLSDRI